MATSLTIQRTDELRPIRAKVSRSIWGGTASLQVRGTTSPIHRRIPKPCVAGSNPAEGTL
jgi:hypothetical protein